jgi:predicted nuclease of restriction endonuclease-like (RecB) superfamily
MARSARSIGLLLLGIYLILAGLISLIGLHFQGLGLIHGHPDPARPLNFCHKRWQKWEEGLFLLQAVAEFQILSERHFLQTRAAFAVNRELLHLYWEMGRDIVLRQEREGWGTAVIERLALDLGRAFPGVAGFSARNLWRMRAFYLAYPPDSEVLPQAVAELPWSHQVVLLEKLKDSAERQWENLPQAVAELGPLGP